MYCFLRRIVCKTTLYSDSKVLRVINLCRPQLLPSAQRQVIVVYFWDVSESTCGRSTYVSGWIAASSFVLS